MSSSAALLETRSLSKRFGGLLATDKVSISVAPLQTHALIGPNGAGKTTLIGQLSGELLPDEGQVLLDGQDVTHDPVYQRTRKGLGRSYQITQVFREFDALENVMMAVLAHQAVVQGRSPIGFWQPFRSERLLRDEAQQALETVGLAADANTLVGVLAHGQHRQLELAMALALKPKILLLDEPLAGMSSSESETMVALLARLKSQYPMLLIEHDMGAVFSLADQISVLVYGKIIASGTADEIRANPDVRAAYLGDEGAH